MNPEPSQEELARMPALHQKRTLAFVNHCVMTNVQCMNNFMQVCEEKLMQFERKLEKVEAAMILLESKLLSVPEVSALTAETKEAHAPAHEPIHENAPLIDLTDNNTNVAETTDNTTDTTKDAPETELVVVARPEYNRFVKMVQVGVPLQAAKLKCALEGLDPNVLGEILGK